MMRATYTLPLRTRLSHREPVNSRTSVALVWIARVICEPTGSRIFSIVCVGGGAGGGS